MRVSALLCIGLVACVDNPKRPLPTCDEDASVADAATRSENREDAGAPLGHILARTEDKTGSLVVAADAGQVVARWRSDGGGIDTAVTGPGLEPGSLRLVDVTGDDLPDIVFLQEGSTPLHHRIRVLVHEREPDRFSESVYAWRYVYDATSIDDAVKRLRDFEHARCSMYEAFMAVQVHRGDVVRFTRRDYGTEWIRDAKPWHHGRHPYAPPRDGREVYTPHFGCNATNDACSFSLASGDTTIPFSDVGYFLKRENGVCVVEAVAMTTGE